MRATDSTRTATRWRWCEAGTRDAGRGTRLHALASRVPRAASPLRSAAIGALMLAAGCTQLVFTPSPGWTRLTPGGLRDEGDAQLRAECSRLADRQPTGEASLSLTLNDSAAVTQAVINRGTGDARVDEIFGRLAVRLQFEPVSGSPAAGQTIAATMGYSCAPSGAAITFRLRQPPLPERAPTDTPAARPPGR